MEKEFNFLIAYDVTTGGFSFSQNFYDYFDIEKLTGESITIHHIFNDDIFFSQSDRQEFFSLYDQCLNATEIFTEGRRFKFKLKLKETVLFAITFSTVVPQKTVTLSVRDLSQEEDFIDYLDHLNHYDDLTGLMKTEIFRETINSFIQNHSDEELSGKYALIYFDVSKFKGINELYGKASGDLLLIHIASTLKDLIKQNELCCRIEADRFAVFVSTEDKNLKDFVYLLFEKINQVQLSTRINCNAGIFIVSDKKLFFREMMDRAILAQSSIKGIFTQQVKFYTEDLRNQLLTEQEIAGQMTKALKNREFEPYFQPQFNHKDGSLIGAEALVRWIHPEKGLVSPGVFIPVFENNGFITPLDMYIFERACEFLRKCIDGGHKPVPVSTNFSRFDIFQSDFVEQLEESRTKYNIPVNLLRIEITESSIFGGTEMTNKVVHKLHECGYIVEMDDFGSGYSSLNVLKDVDFDIIKMDMKFLSDSDSDGRGGTVISSVVNMAKMLNLPVIAEGVETKAQADFLTSIGVDYIQGYFYSRPLPEDKFIALIENPETAVKTGEVQIIDKFDFGDLWNPESLDAILFNYFVGPSCILTLDKSNNEAIRLIRLNKKYIKELGINISSEEILHSDISTFVTESGMHQLKKTMLAAIETKEETECETWRTFNSGCCGTEKVCIRSTLRLISQKKDLYLFFSTIKNITYEKNNLQDLIDNTRRFKAASEQANIYYWEYDVKTRDMHPCFRCMRDLGLPAVVHNYPEPVIENGIFPEDYADLYRQWHKNVEAGVKEQEAIIPLTVGRVPFRVKYTTEFDENGVPVKAYGSATLIINNDE